MDAYTNFAELKEAEREGVNFRVYVQRREDASILVLAPHGGRIEPGTSEVAEKIAGDDLSLALFEGQKSVGNERLHITSTNFDEPRCLDLAQASDTVLVIHGEGSEKPAVFLGGRDIDLREQIGDILRKTGYRVEVHENPGLQGMAMANICNRGRQGAGVQLELSLGLRKTFFESLRVEGRKKPTDDLLRFTAAVREGIRNGAAL